MKEPNETLDGCTVSVDMDGVLLVTVEDTEVVLEQHETRDNGGEAWKYLPKE